MTVMKRSTVGALLILFIGAAGVLGWVYLRPLLFDRDQRRTSDAAGAETTLRFGGDNYLGYWFITSPEMRKQAARAGLSVRFEDDGGAYSERLAKFAAGEYDAIVLPVNSYLQHGAAVSFPGSSWRRSPSRAAPTAWSASPINCPAARSKI